MTDNPYTKAIEVINELGWHQGEYQARTDTDEHDPNGAVCAMGALGVALRGSAYGAPLDDPLLSKVVNEQYPTCPHPGHSHDGAPRSVPCWNDEDGRTKDQVIAVFEKTAVLWDEQIG